MCICAVRGVASAPHIASCASVSRLLHRLHSFVSRISGGQDLDPASTALVGERWCRFGTFAGRRGATPPHRSRKFVAELWRSCARLRCLGVRAPGAVPAAAGVPHRCNSALLLGQPRSIRRPFSEDKRCRRDICEHWRGICEHTQRSSLLRHVPYPSPCPPSRHS